MAQTTDFVAALGALALDHRFKRLSLRLLAEAEAIYQQAGLDFKPRWTSTYRLLDRDGWLAVGEIADQLQLTHPAVIQLTAEMRAAGMVRSRRDPDDGRRRLLGLSPRATAMRDELEALWSALEREQEALFTAGGADVVALLDTVNHALDRRPLAARVQTPTHDGPPLESTP